MSVSMAWFLPPNREEIYRTSVLARLTRGLARQAREQGAASGHDAQFQPKLVNVDVDRGRF